jgi:hypothetical protein
LDFLEELGCGHPNPGISTLQGDDLLLRRNGGIFNNVVSQVARGGRWGNGRDAELC